MKTIFLTLLIIPYWGFDKPLKTMNFLSLFNDGLQLEKKGIAGPLITKTGLLTMNLEKDL